MKEPRWPQVGSNAWAFDEVKRLNGVVAQRDATVDRLVSALKTIGMHPHFIDAILANPGAAPATEETP